MRLRLILAAGLALAATAASPDAAGAANQFTIDHHADSIGPVVVDQSGEGYVAWLHSGNPDVVMFCKLAPEASRCPHAIALPVALSDSTASTDTPFPVLGPGAYVYIVAPSYDTNQMVIWQSKDGGSTFGAASVLSAGSEQAAACRVETDLNDVLAFNAFGAEYNRSQGTATLPGANPAGLDFEMSSSNPYINWTFAYYGQGCAVPLATSSAPGTLPWQYFPFGGGELGSQYSTLGWAGGGSSACPESAPGDEVTAYMDATAAPQSIRYYRYGAPSGACAATGENLSPSASHNWNGPATVTDGAYPRLAGGRAGLFLLSGDALKKEAPTTVDIRPYELMGHNFGAPTQVTRVALASSLQPDSGGLGENYETGELAAIWPDVAGETGLMSLFISSDAGHHFSRAQAIANVGSGYAGHDDARVALAANGTGFVTFQDGAGLHVADLNSLPSPYRRLRVHHRRALEIPVTCEAPKGTCSARALITVRGTRIAGGKITLPSAATINLRLKLNRTGRSLLESAGGHLRAMLTLTITHPGASTERLQVASELIG